jgi:hypothetical protein
MLNWNRIPHMDWALQLNQDVRQKLESSFFDGHDYWRYLDDLVGFLRSKNVAGIQEKVKDADNLDKFYSTVSELEFARILAGKGKDVTLLKDRFFENRTSPDMLVKDSTREMYVEVKRLTEGRAGHLIIDFLRSYLNHPERTFRVNVVLNRELSVPMTKLDQRTAREKEAKEIIEEFRSRFDAIDVAHLPVSFEIAGVTFEIQPTKLQRGYLGVIRTAVFEPSTEMWVEKLAYDVCEKAKKRQSWIGDDLKKLYIVAIDCEEKCLDEDKVDLALIGGTGVFLTNPITKNVSAVMVRFKSGSVYFLPNPFACDEINDAEIHGYLE